METIYSKRKGFEYATVWDGRKATQLQEWKKPTEEWREHYIPTKKCSVPLI